MPAFSISIRQRSKRQSAVAGAAYQSGERLFGKYDLKTKNYSYKSCEVLAKGILLPHNAPPEYADWQTLWNAVEKVEGQWNSQLARGIIMALPNEIPKEEAVRKLETTMKHIDIAISLKPIYEKSKKGFDRQKEKYAAEHKDELERFKKAVRYLKANGLNTDDRDRCAAERSTMNHENERLERKLRSVNLDPDMVAQIKYRIDKVLDVGEMPQHRTTTQERLKQPVQAEQPQLKKKHELEI